VAAAIPHGRIEYVKVLQSILVVSMAAACGGEVAGGSGDASATEPSDASPDVGSSDGDLPAGDGGLSCQLGGACTLTQLCMEPIAGCGGGCQCLGGTWQSPCPDGGPDAGDSCEADGASCGVLHYGVGPCGGSEDCYCQHGQWACYPTCAEPPDTGHPAEASVPFCPDPCDAGTHYCEAQYDSENPDAGVSYFCLPFVLDCDAAVPSCACVSAGTSCTCVDDGGDVNVTCPFHE
jgi:hypothetical protein